MPDRISATASVATAAPERYAKQLASHLGRRCEVHDDPAGTRLVLNDGECLLQPGDQVLELRASAPEIAGLDHVTHVVGSHLERFGRREELRVDWRRG